MTLRKLFSRRNRMGTQMDSEGLWQHFQDLPKVKSNKIIARRKSNEHNLPHSAKKLFTMETSVFINGIRLSASATLQRRPHVQKTLSRHKMCSVLLLFLSSFLLYLRVGEGQA